MVQRLFSVKNLFILLMLSLAFSGYIFFKILSKELQNSSKIDFPNVMPLEAPIIYKPDVAIIDRHKDLSTEYNRPGVEDKIYATELPYYNNSCVIHIGTFESIDVAVYSNNFLNYRRPEMADRYQRPQTLRNFKNPCFLQETPATSCTDSYLYLNSSWFLKEYKYKEKFVTRLNRSSPIVTAVLKPNTEPSTFRLRCLPYFLVIGVAKSGTTDLCFRLVKHSDIHLSMNKEVFYWDFYSYEIKATLHDYLDCFDYPAYNMLHPNDLNLKDVNRLRMNDESKNEAGRPDGNMAFRGIVGECTSTTLTSNPYWRTDERNALQPEPLILTPGDLKKLNPSVKIIAVLREPCSRWYSHFNMWCQDEQHCHPSVFHEKVVNSIAWWEKCVRDHSELACLYGDVPNEPLTDWNLGKFWPVESNFSGTLRDNLYALHLEQWFKHFHKQQILCLKTEELLNGNIDTLQNAVLPFLNMRNLTESEIRSISSKYVKKRAYYSPMYNETNALLTEFFAPFNRRLSSLLLDDKWNWTD